MVETNNRPRLRRGGLALLMTCAIALVMMAGSESAQALTAFKHYPIGSFNAAATTGPGGAFAEVDHIAVNQANGTVYVTDRGHGGVLDKFDAAGVPQNFTAPEPDVSSLATGPISGEEDLAIDNSFSASQGQLYAFAESGAVHSWDKEGTILAGNFPLNVASVCGAATDSAGALWLARFGTGLVDFDHNANPLGHTFGASSSSCHTAINTASSGVSAGYFYLASAANGKVTALNKSGSAKYVVDSSGKAGGVAVDSSSGEIYVNHGGHVLEWAPSAASAGAQVSAFGEADPAHGLPSALCSTSAGIAVNEATHYVYVSDCNRVVIFGPGEAVKVPTVTTDGASPTPTSAVLHGHVDPDGGGDSTECFFKWGVDTSYSGGAVPCLPATVHEADGNTEVLSAPITGLAQGTTYHFKLFAANANGASQGLDKTFKAQSAPLISEEAVSEVNTDGARLSATVDPANGPTHYRFEWGPDSSYGASAPVPDAALPDEVTPQSVSVKPSGLAPATTYHFRIVAENNQGPTIGADHTFTTFAPDPATDPCPNAHVRQQTATALLLDCRAYELVSAASTGGYDVESDLVAGQTPLEAHPTAQNRLLYTVHFGAIPNSGSPTNFAADPYLATRTDSGWQTKYVGVPATGTPSAEPFSSALTGAAGSLSAFAFGAAHGCDPCFGDGSVGIPVRTPSGALVQGMAGSQDPGLGASADGYVAAPFSADGRYFLFGSTSEYEPGAASGGDVSIYQRDLLNETTEVISKTPAGANLPCLLGANACHGPTNPHGIAELAVSADGSRAIVAQLVSTDAKGNEYWRPFMHFAGQAQSLDLAPGATHGVLFAGASEDGRHVYFTTTDKLAAADTDKGADLYEAFVDDSGNLELNLLSGAGNPGGVGDTDACSPVSNHESAHWNDLGEANCSVLAFSGGAGVASQGGAVYFLSPEKLDGQGSQDQPNVFLARPGEAPQYLTTLEPDHQAVRDALANNQVHEWADFGVSASGEDAVFTTALPLTEFPTQGHTEVYRFHAPSGAVDCVSCANATNAASTTDASLAAHGASLSDDGRVFFTTGDPLVLRDTDAKADVYEWSEGVTQIISSGRSLFDSGLLSVSRDGADAFFFTRDKLVAQDENGQLVKIYDARANGGFAVNPPLAPCQASDECHGPGTQAAAPPAIGTYTGSGGNQVEAQAKPKKHKQKKHKKRHHKKHAAAKQKGGRR